MSESAFSVVITPKEIYDAVRQLSGKLDVLIEQLNHTNSKLEETRKDLDDTKKDFEDRLRSLEKGRWPLPAVATLVALASLGVAVFTMLNH